MRQVYSTLYFIFPTEQITPPPPSGQCNYTGQVRLLNRYAISPSFGNSPAGLEGFGGLLEICINETFHRVCVNDTYSDVDANDLARRACADLGLISMCFCYICVFVCVHTFVFIILQLTCSSSLEHIIHHLN